jgi:adenylate cyclase
LCVSCIEQRDYFSAQCFVVTARSIDENYALAGFTFERRLQYRPRPLGRSGHRRVWLRCHDSSSIDTNRRPARRAAHSRFIIKDSMSEVFPVAYLEAEIEGQQRRFPLTGEGVCRIGRSDKNDIVLIDDLASRNHAMLQRSGEGCYYISDLGSSNGTLVNGARISVPVILRHGGHITIGNHEFTFFQETVDPTMPVEEADELQSTNILFAEKLITVLVVDIRDFTGLARRVEAGKLSQLTGTFFREAGKALKERGAWEQKYIGDAVMAVWLHKKREPEPRELLAVFDGICKLSKIAAGLQKQFGLESAIRIGAGVNTGLASVGNVGSIASSDYTALGDVVNKAFRLESATKELGCDLLIGLGTHDFLASSIDAAGIFQSHVVKLKGYDEPVTAFAAQLASLSSVLESLH